MPDIHEMKSAIVVAEKSTRELIFRFLPRDNDPEVFVALPHGSIGDLIAQVAAAHQDIAMSSDESGANFLPLSLSGAREFEAPDGTPVLLLQFEKAFEVAVMLSKTQADVLSRILVSLFDGGGSDRIGRN